jgi:hypothetical protein
MKPLTTIAVSTIAILALTTTGLAQAWLKADHKMSANRVHTNNRHARSQAQTLYHATQAPTTQAPRPVPKDDLRELVASIRKDLEASNKALAKLEAEFGKVKEAAALFESIKKHNAQVAKDCEACEKACEKPDADNVTIAENAADIYYELEDAEADADKLLKVLKIEDLEAPKKPTKKK